MDQPTAGSRLRRLLSRSVLVLGGAVTGTALAWLLSAGAASASQGALTPLGPRSLPAPVATVADVAGLAVTTAEVPGEDTGDSAGEDITGTRRGDLRPLSEIVLRQVQRAPQVKQVEQVEQVALVVEKVTRDTADELWRRVPSVVLPPTSLRLGGSPQAEAVADPRNTEPRALPTSSVDNAGADPHGDPAGRCGSYRCAPVGYPTGAQPEVSAQRLGAGRWPAFIRHNAPGQGPVGLIHFPRGPVPASCSGGQGHGDMNSGSAEQSLAVTNRAGAVKAPRPMTQWAPLVRADQPCTTPD